MRGASGLGFQDLGFRVWGVGLEVGFRALIVQKFRLQASRHQELLYNPKP